MTSTVDTNVLVVAVNTASPHQARARQLLDWVEAGPEVVHLFWPVVMGFLRIVTHPSIFAKPLDPEVAATAIDRLQQLPHIRVSGESDGFWETYQRVAQGVSPKGNLVTDTHIAALMREHGVSAIWTNDRDFRKFDGITVRDPFHERYAKGFE